VEVTAEDFERLLTLLDPDRERAAERYESIRCKLIRFFEWRGSPLPEDLADVTFDRVARALGRGLVIQSEDPYSYIRGVAYLVHKEQQRASARQIRIEREGQAIRPPDVPPGEEEEDPRQECLRRCLERLPAEQRQLLLGYHAGENRIKSRQQLAESLGDSLNALRIKVHRVRRQVESCLAQCLGLPGKGETGRRKRE
jgi:DNA-directed RNA polymerase specialized sigma24 family protein